MKRILKKTPLGLLVLLSACSGQEFKDTVGLSRHSPDEFMILTNEPLQIPTQTTLPKPGTVQKISSNRITPQEQAMQAFSNKEKPVKPAQTTAGDEAFLSKMPTIDENITAKIAEDNKNAQKSFITGTVTVNVLDPVDEKERIKELQDENKPLTGDNVPTVKVREKVSE